MPETGNNHINREYALSIQADLNGFSFCVSSAKGACLTLKSFSYTVTDYNDLDGEIHKLFRQEPLLRARYEKCVCLFISEKSTLIPSPLFDVQHLRHCLDFVAPLEDLDEIHFRQLASLNAMNVFAIPSPVAAAVSMYQPNAVFYHQSIPLIRLLGAQHPQQGAMLQLNEKLTSLVLYAEGRMVLSNTYKTSSFADSLYFLSYAVQQWQLSSKTLQVYVAGQISPEEELLLQSYYPQTELLRDKSIALMFGQAAGTRHYLLQQLISCE